MIRRYTELCTLLDIDFSTGSGELVTFVKQGSKNYKASLTKYQPEQFRVDVTCYEVDVTLDPNVGRHIL